MNNKQIGNAFERKVVDKLTILGYWTHFLSPDSRGAQPFDVLAIKGSRILAIDCKTCKAKDFTINRLEDNQKYAFETILKKTSAEALLVVEHDDHIFVLPYESIKKLEKIRLVKDTIYTYKELEEELNAL